MYVVKHLKVAKLLLRKVLFPEQFSFSGFRVWFCLVYYILAKNKSRCLYLNWPAEETLVVNNKNDRVFLSRNYRSHSCHLEI